MKKLLGVLYIIGSMTFPLISHATTWCDLFELHARIAMRAHQEGQPLSDQIKRLRQQGADNKISEKITAALEEIYVDAYSETRFHTDENQDRAIADYQNKVYLECYKIFNEK